MRFARQYDATRIGLLPEPARDEPNRHQMWVSFAAHVLVAAVVLFSVQADDRLVATLVPVAAFVLQVAVRTSDAWVDVKQATLNGAALLVLALVAPSTWILAMIVITALASSRSAPPQQRVSTMTINAATTITLGTIGLVNGQEFAIGATVLSLGASLAVRRLFSLMVDQVHDIRSELDTLYSSIGVAVAVSDRHTGRDSWVSPSIEHLTGWTAKEWVSKDQTTLIHPDDLADYWVPKEAFHAGNEYQRTGRFKTKDGGWVWLRARTRVLAGEDGELILRGHYEDATEIVAGRQELERHASEDNLTGLPNRRTLMKALTRRLADDESFALLLIDADRFKDINDTLGHSIGDEALIALSKRIASASPGHLLCRIGGDEFALIIDEPRHIASVAAAISTATDQPLRIRDLVLPLEVSIGGVQAPDDGTSVNELLSRCDSAMYSAKSQRQRYVRFGHDHERRSLERLQLVSELSTAIDRGEIHLHFQSQHDLRTGAIVSFEGLARWEHRDLGLLQPADFLAGVAVSHFALDFAVATIDQATAFIASLNDAGAAMPVAVNVSMVALLDSGFVPAVQAAIERHRIQPNLLVVELTEEEMMDEGQATLSSIRSLATLGVRMSIDDFGTGHSSLERLVDMPIHQIKIDRRFISAPTNGSKEQIVTKAVIELGRQLGLDVVAEGIETESQRDHLIANGCAIGQGFLYSRATPPPAALDQLTRVTTAP